MRYYGRNRPGGGKAKKIIGRIIFVISAALIITALAALIGNYLLSKINALENAENDIYHAGNQVWREENEDEHSNYSPESVFAAGIDITLYENEDELVLAINELSKYYDTLNIKVTDSDGKFVYTSPALCTLTRTPEISENENYALLSSAITAASVVGMRVCVIMTPSDFQMQSSPAAILDATVATELSSMGVDEILLLPGFDTQSSIEYSLANKLRIYLSELSGLLGDTCKVGIALSADSYLNVSNAKQLQMIASCVSFLAIEFSDSETSSQTERYTEISDKLSSLRGSFSVYNMRVLLRSVDSVLLSAEYSACIDSNVNNISFIPSITPDKLSYNGEQQKDTESQDETSADQSLDADEKNNTNPYSEVPQFSTESESQDDLGENSDNHSWY